jgi:chromosome segregation ATPase
MTVKVRPSKVRISSREGNSSIDVLREENSRLRTDISRLRIEKAQLRDENSHLKAENVQLSAEKARMKEDFDFMFEELQEERQSSEIKDIEIAKNNALYYFLQEEHLRLHID